MVADAVGAAGVGVAAGVDRERRMRRVGRVGRAGAAMAAVGTGRDWRLRLEKTKGSGPFVPGLFFSLSHGSGRVALSAPMASISRRRYFFL